MRRNRANILVFLVIVAVLIYKYFDLARYRATQQYGCYENLQTLAAAVTAHAQSVSLKQGDSIQEADILPFLKDGMPQCPSDGNAYYLFMKYGNNPICTHHGDLLLRMNPLLLQ